MGRFISIVAACIHFFYGPFIFNEPVHHKGTPAVSYIIAVLSVCQILWALTLYPRKLRKLFWPMDYVIQYLIALYLLEFIITNVWAPLDAFIVNLPADIVIFVDDYIDCRPFCSVLVLKMHSVGVLCSYLQSVALVIAALHTTRMINLRLLSKGLTPFFSDITIRFRKFSKNIKRSCGLHVSKRKSDNKKGDFCSTDEDDYDIDPYQSFDHQHDQYHSYHHHFYDKK